ncbi:MAG TPA: PP2C family protein-serine/threonine phosphatase [Nocardioides sp.]|nr:PP2C family protein-serine/threonine phosphatase [Nocardioides sp.]
MADPYVEAGSRLFEGMLARTHTTPPARVAEVVAEELESALGARDVTVFMVNLEETALVPIPRRDRLQPEPQDIENSMVGRSFTGSKVLSAPGAEAGRLRAFVPLIDGTDRLGALQADVTVDGSDQLPEPLVRLLERYGHAIAQVLLAKHHYGDALHLVQRSRPLELGAELLASVLPPATFATDGLVISAMVQPAYENGGDAFDYAVNEDAVHLAVFDAVGHGLQAARLSTFAVAAYRWCRRAGQGLPETYAALDAAMAEQFRAEDFTTGILAELNPDAGVLRFVNAGHPPPLLLRGDRTVKVLDAARTTPLGLPLFGTEPTVVEERLESGDIVVLYTDGVTEARDATGSLLGVDGLIEFLQREATAEEPPPETLRRLRGDLTSEDGPLLTDDATVLLVYWHRGAERSLLPQTVSTNQEASSGSASGPSTET